MYLLGVSVILYICYVLYNRYFSVPDYPAFGEESECSCASDSQIIEYKVYSMDDNKIFYSACDKDEFIRLVSDLTNGSTNLLYVVNYLQSEDDYICFSNTLEIINLLPYTKVNNFLFARLPTKAIIKINDSKVIDITDFIHKFIGPNLNFHNDISPTTVNDLCLYLYYTETVEELNKFSLIEIRDEILTLEIMDNLEDTHKFSKNDKLVWNPDITTSLQKDKVV